MRLGLYYDLRNPGGARSWARVYAAALDRIGWADGAGIGAIWVTEHHGFADGYLPAPLTFCAAVAARTRRARIGTAVVVSPLIPPPALAEQAAVVDILSDGRLELGLGAGWRESEFAAFGADYARRYEALEHAVRTLPRLWASGRVTPAPLQRPLPVWVGARGPRGARLAGRTGAGLLWIDRDLFGPVPRVALAQSDPPALPRVGGLVNVFLADDPDLVRAAVRENGRRNWASVRRRGLPWLEAGLSRARGSDPGRGRGLDQLQRAPGRRSPTRLLRRHRRAARRPGGAAHRAGRARAGARSGRGRRAVSTVTDRDLLSAELTGHPSLTTLSGARAIWSTWPWSASLAADPLDDVVAAFGDLGLSSNGFVPCSTCRPRSAAPRRLSGRRSSPAGWWCPTRRPTPGFASWPDGAFRQQRVVAMGAWIGEIVDNLLDEFIASGSDDFVNGIAYPLPAIAISRMMGAPDEDRLKFQEWSDELALVAFGAGGDDRADRHARAPAGRP